jgi:tetratricopeptide (TPR) repeat protein
MAPLNKHLAVNELSAKDFFEKGLALTKSGKYQEAIEAYSKGIELDPQNATSYYNRGNVYGRRLGNYPLAIEDFNRAIELNPEFVSAYDNRANANFLLGNYREAIRDCEQAIRLDPKDPLPYFYPRACLLQTWRATVDHQRFQNCCWAGFKTGPGFLKVKGYSLVSIPLDNPGHSDAYLAR